MNLNIISSIFKGYSLLRAYQIDECKNIRLKGRSIEFGAYKNKKRNFNNFFKGIPNCKLSNIYNHNHTNYIKLDLTKKFKLKKNSFNNVIIFNVLEHLPDTKNVFSEIKNILKKDGTLIGSTPFIYQVHGAPNDYFRFTKDFFYENLKKKFKKIYIKQLGHGPFIASFSLINPYLKFLPILREVILIFAYILDSLIQIFVKTKLSEIYPIGFLFIIKK
jgi:SAM-dependent methyltransferase